VVAASDAGSADGRSALEALCETYWTPVNAFIRRTGRSGDDADDLTQAFFAKLLEKNYVGDARRERGRFRSFLLTSVRNFLANEHDHAQTLKRGGRLTHVSIEAEREEPHYRHEPVDQETPEDLYERQWALTVLDAARTRLALKHEGDERHQVFEQLMPFLTGDEPASYSVLAGDLGMSQGALRVAVHRLRQQYGDCLRELIAETVVNPDDVADELRHLMTLLST